MKKKRYAKILRAFCTAINEKSKQVTGESLKDIYAGVRAAENGALPSGMTREQWVKCVYPAMHNTYGMRLKEFEK